MLDPSSKRGAALRAAMPGGAPPALPQLFSVGQFVRCVVAQLTTTAAAGGEQDEAAAAADAGAGEAHGVWFVLFCCMCCIRESRDGKLQLVLCHLHRAVCKQWGSLCAAWWHSSQQRQQQQEGSRMRRMVWFAVVVLCCISCVWTC
jgi:hypothetical protein